jgi:hypothetical protein
MPQKEEGRMLREVGKVLSHKGKMREAMGMAIRVEGMEMGKTGEDRLRWPITTLQGFSRRGIPLH